MACFGDGLAVGPDLVRAAESAVRQATEPLGGQSPELLCVFVSYEDPAAVEEAGLRAMEIAGAGTTLGCGAGGVIADGRGVEGTGAVAVWAAVLPGARRQSFRLTARQSPEGMLVDGLPERWPDDAVAVLLADPYSFPASEFVESSSEALAGLPLVGGLASGQRGPGSTRLFLDGRVVDQGAVGVVLGGPVAVRTLVSQGCRPIGPTMIVTKASGNVLFELAGMPAYRKLEEIVTALPPDDQALAMRGLHIGIAMDEYAEEHERGDFLIRGVIGADPHRGALAIGNLIEVGQTVRFQVRDADAAHDELQELLTRFRADGPVEGALLFSCNGRGAALFSSADHDVLALHRGLGITGVAGFFAAGEIGPVAGRNHVHGFTASVLTFAEPG
ncbi:MAG: FIST C-terminal domain-containing protein [Actinomycetota bacterium]|nr:FIST C-terminal domain-containing protein [Actinomycetota bacterium]